MQVTSKSPELPHVHLLPLSSPTLGLTSSRNPEDFIGENENRPPLHFAFATMAFPQLLVGKVAAITGGLTGIGRVCQRSIGSSNERRLTKQAIALDYIRHGAKVSISHLGGEKETALLEALRNDVKDIEAEALARFITVSGDISQPETGRNFVAKTVETFGRLDVFVSNAGVCQFAEFLE